MAFVGPLKELQFQVKLSLQNVEREANSEMQLPEAGAAVAMNW